jgi:hypothetical protein
MPARRAIALAVLVIAVGACSPSDGAGDPAAGGSTSTTAPAAAPTTSSLVPVGDPVNRFTLAVGDCFNRYDAIEVTTRVPCDTPHDREAFAKLSYPAPFGEPFPSEPTMEHFAIQGCYAEFAAYVGAIYELSTLGVGAITPTKENFEDQKARYRGITCFLVSNDGKPLVGSMRGTKR